MKRQLRNMGQGARWWLLVPMLLASTPASAQRPFSVTITSRNPLPIGLCSAVQLQLVDGTGSRPRNLAGYLMGIADFDMSVTAADPKAVVGHQVDQSHWSVCGCQAGKAGAEATITAAYPAQRLTARERLPGVAFQEKMTFKLSAAAGGVDPPGCSVPAPVTIAVAEMPTTPLPPSAGRTVPTAPTTTGAPVKGTPAPPPPPPAPVPAPPPPATIGQPLPKGIARKVPATGPIYP